MSAEESGVAPERAVSGRALGSAYHIETVIGRGSTGEVWRGQVRETGEPIAAKVLDAALTRDPEVVTRFIRERSLLTKVAHPSVVSVRDLVVEGDTLAIITDLVDGPSLRAVLDDLGTMRPSHAIELVEQVLRGLDAVHSQGLVHRDLKPENVLVAAGEDGEADARIVDFGIAQLAHGASANARGEVIGSAEYIAPELLEGGKPSPAADIYAVGIILYELLCGRTPFGSENVATVIRRQLDEPAGRPAGMPQALWTVIQQMLAKNPDRRPPTASDALRQLASVEDSVRSLPPLPVSVEDDPVILDGDETIITPRGRPNVSTHQAHSPASPPSRRRWWLIAAAAVVMTAVATSVVVLTGGTDAAASIQSAPEYWTSPTGGRPIIHRTLTLDNDSILVNLVVRNRPVHGYTAHEFIPAGFRSSITVSGKRVRDVGPDGLLLIHIAGRDLDVASLQYRVGLGDVPASQATLARYERARVELMQAAPSGPNGNTLIGLEVGSAIRLRPFERAWLPVGGIWATADRGMSVADSLGSAWHWSSSDSSVAVAAQTKVHAPGPGRSAGRTYFEVSAITRGTTTLSTSVAGHRYSVHVTVGGAPLSRRSQTCESGVDIPGVLYVGPGETSHPITGTLLGYHGTTYKALAPDRSVAVVPHVALCSDPSVAQISAADKARFDLFLLLSTTSKG